MPAGEEISVGDQYTRQTVGWPQTWEYLQKVLHAQGPFDGILGFSQVYMQTPINPQFLASYLTNLPTNAN